MDVTPFPLRSHQQGLVVVDMQNDFVREGAPQEVPDARRILPAVQRLLTTFRDARRPVFFTRFIAGPHRTLMWAFSPECTDEVRSCWRGHQRRYEDRSELLEGSDVVDELAPLPGEEVIDKFGYNAFHNTNLADALRAHNVTQLVVAGTVTQICVEDTVRGGFHLNLEMVVVEDAVASFDPELHSASLRGMAMKYAVVAPSEAIVESLSGGGLGVSGGGGLMNEANAREVMPVLGGPHTVERTNPESGAQISDPDRRSDTSMSTRPW